MVFLFSLYSSAPSQLHLEETSQPLPPHINALRSNFTRSELQNILRYAMEFEPVYGVHELPLHLFPEVDVVIPWVNSSDPDWIEARAKFEGVAVSEGEAAMRWKEHNELLFAIRSIYLNLPWVRRIHIVCMGNAPTWLNKDDGRIQIVPESAIFRNSSHLPTFNSVAVESQIHLIPGLADKYIELNDEFMFSGPVWPHDFWTLDRHGEENYIFTVSGGNKPKDDWQGSFFGMPQRPPWPGEPRCRGSSPWR